MVSRSFHGIADEFGIANGVGFATFCGVAKDFGVAKFFGVAEFVGIANVCSVAIYSSFATFYVAKDSCVATLVGFTTFFFWAGFAACIATSLIVVGFGICFFGIATCTALFCWYHDLF